MTDPYRTPGAVETPEQRVERLRDAYWNMAAMNTPSDPNERAKAMTALLHARDAWLNAATPRFGIRDVDHHLGQRYREAMNGMTQQQRDAYQALFQVNPAPIGAGDGTP